MGVVNLEEALRQVAGVFQVWRRWRTLKTPPCDGGFMAWPAVLAEAFEILNGEYGVFEVWDMADRAKAAQEDHHG